ncbi:MAG: hypothetical protein ACPG6N_01220 [Flavobacteriales bacterium]
MGSSKADANPSLDEALWNNIESSLNGPQPVGGTAGQTVGLNWALIRGVTLFAAGVGVGLMWNDEQLYVPIAQSVEAAAVEQPVRANSSSEASEPRSSAAFSQTEGSSISSKKIEPALADVSRERPSTEIAADNDRLESAAPNNFQTETVDSEPAFDMGMPSLPSVGAGDPFNSQITQAPLSGGGPFVLEPQNPFIPPLALDPIGISSNCKSTGPLLQQLNRDLPARARHFAVRAFGGLTLSHFSYQNLDLTPFSDRFHTASSIGSGFAFDFEYKSQDWSVGLGWLDFAQRLEFEHTWQTEFVDPNGVLSLEIDAITGDTIAMETGPLLVTATHHRHVRDFNHISAVVVPVEWRKQALLSRWTLGAALGGQFLLRTGASGQSFVAEGTLARFDDADLPRKRISWSPTARVYTGYQFLPEWRLDVSVAASFQSMGSRSNEDLTGSALTAWEGQLRTLHIAAGFTRYFELLRSSDVK